MSWRGCGFECQRVWSPCRRRGGRVAGKTPQVLLEVTAFRPAIYIQTLVSWTHNFSLATCFVSCVLVMSRCSHVSERAVLCRLELIAQHPVNTSTSPCCPRSKWSLIMKNTKLPLHKDHVLASKSRIARLMTCSVCGAGRQGGDGVSLWGHTEHEKGLLPKMKHCQCSGKQFAQCLFSDGREGFLQVHCVVVNTSMLLLTGPLCNTGCRPSGCLAVDLVGA